MCTLHKQKFHCQGKQITRLHPYDCVDSGACVRTHFEIAFNKIFTLVLELYTADASSTFLFVGAVNFVCFCLFFVLLLCVCVYTPKHLLFCGTAPLMQDYGHTVNM